MKLLIAGWSDSSLQILGLFIVGWILLIMICAMFVAGLGLFLINIALKRAKIVVPGWVNIILFIVFSSLFIMLVLHITRLDTLFK